MFCYFCGILGHDLKHCDAHFTAEKNGGCMEYQYGDFLRATGGVQVPSPMMRRVQVLFQSRFQTSQCMN